MQAKDLTTMQRMEGLFAQADQFELRPAKARWQMQKITLFLLARAFAGKFVSQDLSDEPASKVLERHLPSLAKGVRR